MKTVWLCKKKSWSPADPPTRIGHTLGSQQGDTIPLNAERTLRVLGVRDDDADQPPALVVEDAPNGLTELPPE